MHAQIYIDDDGGKQNGFNILPGDTIHIEGHGSIYWFEEPMATAIKMITDEHAKRIQETVKFVEERMKAGTDPK